MADKYKNFQELSSSEKEGTDFIIEKSEGASGLCVLAIHGGRIEPGTTEVARSLAGEKHSFYSFMGVKPANNFLLHITSNNFDEPQAVELVAQCEKVISIHGKEGVEQFVMLGGLDVDLIEKNSSSLQKEGFKVFLPSDEVRGDSPRNICNKGLSRKGLQVEISRGLRDVLLKDEKLLERFSQAITY